LRNLESNLPHSSSNQSAPDLRPEVRPFGTSWAVVGVRGAEHRGGVGSGERRGGAVEDSAMASDAGFRRLVAFSDAVVAIAITLLILPLVDAAGAIGTESIDTFLGDNRTRLLAFLLSFTVIGRFWWAQHQAQERVEAYNPVFVSGMFVWLLGIVFLPFPTELLSSAVKSSRGIHALYRVAARCSLPPSASSSSSSLSSTGPSCKARSTVVRAG